MRKFTFNHFHGWTSNYIWWWLYQLFTIALATFNCRRALLFNRLGALGVLCLFNLASFGDISSPSIEYLWILFGDSPTNSLVITIGDNLGDSRTHSSTVFISYVTHFHGKFVMWLQITRYCFPNKETNQILKRIWHLADCTSCMLLRCLRQLISSWYTYIYIYTYVVSCSVWKTVKGHLP